MGFLDQIGRGLEEAAENIRRKEEEDQNKLAGNLTIKKLDDEIMNYVVLRNQDLEKLEEFVSVAIRKGWIPAGGISSIPATGGAMFQQAVYRNARK